ncbi:MAG: thioredoxin family protein [Bacteroidales bacterium]|jgi:thiol:disulfide interchange protein DsbD|nr:thioredoxin family protein [Bacteroidales bacterium]
MKRYIIHLSVALFFICHLTGFSQSPASWNFQTKKVNDSIYDLIMKVKLQDNWHIYSQTTKGTELPIEFNFENGKYEKIGKVNELTKPHVEYDIYEKDSTRYFSQAATFSQKIKVKSVSDIKIKGNVTFQLCEKGQCIPPDDVEFSFDVKGNPKISDTLLNQNNILENSTETKTQTVTESETIISQSKNSQITEENFLSNDMKNKSWFMIFIISFVAGLLTLITPCVFPMIPMTISFFLKGHKSNKQGRRLAYVFGLSIIFIFAVLGLALTLIFGKQAMYIISTHWIPNLFFFLIFIAFAFSFFGLFDITLPSSWVNKSDKQADKGGYKGAFFIALTTVLVSFSCTGPILGAALVGMASGSSNSFVFLVSMLGFAIGFALPFTLLAMFPAVLNKMKSGSWLNTVKIVFGFLEIALGLKFLSMADLSANWGLLSRTTYLCLWIVIFTMLGFYLLGKLKFKGDNELEKISVTRLLLSIVTFSFVIYMIPGLWGAPLKTISGYLPPISTQEFNIEKLIADNSNGGSITHTGLPKDRKFAAILHSKGIDTPIGFEAFYDLEEAKAYAKKVSKPIFIDFTGKTCANCREMENFVWTDSQVKKILQNEFVMVALYCDENTIKLAPEDYITNKEGKQITTLGKKNHTFQMERFNANAQPLYVLMDSEENLLTASPKPYDRNIDNFVKFLNEGLNAFKQNK